MQIARSEDLYFYSAIAIMINNKAEKAPIVPQIEDFHHLHTKCTRQNDGKTRYFSYICRCKSVIIHFQPYYNNDEQRIEPIRQEPEVRTGDILTSNDRFGLQPKTVESTLRRVVAPPPENKSKDIAMNKRDLFIYLRGLLTFVIFASAITWFHFHADQLLSPRMSYIVHLSLSIGITILLTISFLTLCWYLLVTVFNKGLKLTMKTRLLVASLCLVGILLLQDAFGIPLGLPERISRIINTIFGNGV